MTPICPSCGSKDITLAKERRYFFNVTDVPSTEDGDPDWLNANLEPIHKEAEKAFDNLGYRVVCRGCNEVIDTQWV